MKVILQDHQDSFTYNIAEWFAKAGTEVEVREFENYVEMKHLTPSTLLVLGPGPGSPRDYPQLQSLLKNKLPCPVLGICLGFQAMGAELGWTLQNLEPHFGAIETLDLNVEGEKFAYPVCRYHALGFLEVNSPEVEILARSSEDHSIQAFRVPSRNWVAVQFHPESIGSHYPCDQLLKLFTKKL
jgi:anthranilate synthase component 2